MQEPAKILPEILVQNAKVVARRDHLLPLIKKNAFIIEVGVMYGQFSEKILNICKPKHFVGLDVFVAHEWPIIWGEESNKYFQGKTHEQFYLDKFAEYVKQGVVSTRKGFSHDTLKTFEDKSLDVVYLDADHTYEMVSGELAIVKDKIKDDGIIIVNDYTMNDGYGVVQAVNEFMINEDWEMKYFALEPLMYCDVWLEKKRPKKKFFIF